MYMWLKTSKYLCLSSKQKKSQFTRFVGFEDESSQGLLLDRLELWINSTPVNPAINKPRDLALMELIFAKTKTP